MKSPSRYHIQKRKDGRSVVTVMFKGKRQSIFGKTKKDTLEKLTKVINDIQYAKIHNLPGFVKANSWRFNGRILILKRVYQRYKAIDTASQ